MCGFDTCFKMANVRDGMSSYLPVFEDDVERDDLIEEYFHLGLKYKEI